MLRRLIGFLMPATMRRIEAESKTWFVACPECNHEISVWDAGGMRYRGRGTTYRFGHCTQCGHRGMLRVYRADDSAAS